MGNGQNTVARVLFRKRELIEFCGKLGEFCEKPGEFTLADTHTQATDRKELTEPSPWNSVRARRLTELGA